MTELNDAYKKYSDLGFILNRTQKLKKHSNLAGSYEERKAHKFDPSATGYAAIIPPTLIIVDSDSYEEGCEFDKFVKDLGYKPEPFAFTPSGGEHYAFENPYAEKVVGQHDYKQVDIYAGYQSVVPIVGTEVLNKQNKLGKYSWADFDDEFIINKWDDKLLTMLNMKDRGENKQQVTGLEAEMLGLVKAAVVDDEEMDRALMALPTDYEYDTWIEVGMAIYDRYDGSDEGKKRFVAFSKRSSKYDPKAKNFEDPSAKWDKGHLVPNKITYKSLLYKADEAILNTHLKDVKSCKTKTDFDKYQKVVRDTKWFTTYKRDEQLEEIGEKLRHARKDTGVDKRLTQLTTIMPELHEVANVPDKITYPDIDRKGKLLPTFANALHFHNNFSHTKLSFDVISKRVIVNGSYDVRVGEKDIALSTLKDNFMLSGFTKTMASENFDSIIYSNQVNGLLDFVKEIEYDPSHDYIQDIADSINTGEDRLVEYVREVIKCIFIQAIAAWSNRKGTPHRLQKLESVLVFVGGQGTGKTTWVGHLMPDKMAYFFKDGLELDPSDTDSKAQALSAGMVELGELDATTRKADIANLKAFLSNLTDEWRAPYGRFPEEHPRQTVFIGTVNTPDYLKDATGSRRFLTVKVKKLILPNKNIILKAWAQALHLYKQGVTWRLSDEMMAMQENTNKLYTDVGYIGDIVTDFTTALSLCDGKKKRMSVSAILKGVMDGKRVVNSRERSDFVAQLALHGIERNKEGKYYLPIDVFQHYNKVTAQDLDKQDAHLNRDLEEVMPLLQEIDDKEVEKEFKK